MQGICLWDQSDAVNCCSQRKERTLKSIEMCVGTEGWRSIVEQQRKITYSLLFLIAPVSLHFVIFLFVLLRISTNLDHLLRVSQHYPLSSYSLYKSLNPLFS
jgi:hypothetical protein